MSRHRFAVHGRYAKTLAATPRRIWLAAWRSGVSAGKNKPAGQCLAGSEPIAGIRIVRLWLGASVAGPAFGM